MQRRGLTQREQEILRTYAPSLFAQYQQHATPPHTLKHFLVQKAQPRLKLPSLSQPVSRCSLPRTPPRLPSALLAEVSGPALFSGVTEAYIQGRSRISAVYCSQELAFEVIQRKYPEALKAEYGLKRAQYNGDAFVLVSPSAKAVGRATRRLSQLLKCLASPAPKPANTGSSPDLVGVPYSEAIEYAGSLECTFCSNYCEPGQLIRRTPCLHIFHMDCIQRWLVAKSVCPIDKMPLQ